ncbi:MAG: hypothetical protein WC797_03115 [Candidatus Paceibacterota bacterium]|jgi:hypothetical protein
MDNNIQTSFIPRKTLAPKSSEVGEGSFSGVLLLVATVIFVATLVIFGGAYLYKKSAAASLEKMTQELGLLEASLESEKVLFEDLVAFDKKLQIANQLIESHVTMRPFLDILANNTLKAVRFRNLNYKVNGSGGADIKMDGEAKSFNAVAQQSKSFADTKKVTDIVFSGLDVGSNNNVVFNMSANLKGDSTSYVQWKEDIINQQEAQ